MTVAFERCLQAGLIVSGMHLVECPRIFQTVALDVRRHEYPAEDLVFPCRTHHLHDAFNIPDDRNLPDAFPPAGGHPDIGIATPFPELVTSQCLELASCETGAPAEGDEVLVAFFREETVTASFLPAAAAGGMAGFPGRMKWVLGSP